MKSAVLITVVSVTLMIAFLQVTASYRKGICFVKYTKGKGCRKVMKVGAARKMSFEDCCKNNGQGWSARRKNRKSCKPCVEIIVAQGYWATWGGWSECSATCGSGYRQRKRECIKSKQNSDCRGKAIETRTCQKDPCPVDGGWTAWSKWGPCSVTCGKGFMVQKRSCSNPKPKHGGRECQGELEKWKNCELQKHCPIDGGWGEWSTWGACSKTCDLGTKSRSRKCDAPKPKYGGKPCNATEAIGIDACREERCGKTSVFCDEGSAVDCASGSGSGWKVSYSGSGSGSESGSGFGSGEGLSGENKFRWGWKPKLPDDEDFL